MKRKDLYTIFWAVSLVIPFGFYIRFLLGYRTQIALTVRSFIAKFSPGSLH